ncbi:hypothetical protein G6L37_07420 [Agrobacterium rubi]|nr:hypothetical protein [Agrobacterium rubi]NTF25197.1 hypothetical protein [Agrobacterium rubi]
MAGTGHGYEIANIADVRAAIAGLVSTAQADSVAVAWLSGRSFLRYVTSEPFVFKARKSVHMPFLDDVPLAERDFIRQKMESGGDVRLFSSSEFRRAGPDVPHILDWMTNLRETRPQDHAKIPRMAAEDLIRKVSSWIKPKSRKTVRPEGNLRHLFDTSDGYQWVELLDRNALLAEGDAMSHCVDRIAYVHELEHGRMRILSMRSTDGRRLLTMELRGDGSTHSPLHVRQIQAFGNQTPPDGAVGSICEILNHLGVAPRSSDQERRARIAYVSGEGWQSIFKTWKRIELGGLECITDGDELVFMSPAHPDRPLLNVTSMIPNVFRSLGGDLSVPATGGHYQARLADDRHFNIVELRAAATVANIFSARINSEFFAHTPETGCTPYVDTLLQEDASGQSYLRDRITDNAYVTHESDKAMILLEIGKPRFSSPKEESRLLQAWAYNVLRWKDTDLVRALTVMTARRVSHFGTSARDLLPISTKYEPTRMKDGRWLSFMMEAKRVEGRKPDVHWLETPYRIAMYSGDRRQIDLEIEEGKLQSLPYTWRSDLDCTEIVARLNKLSIIPSQSIRCSKIAAQLDARKRGSGRIVCIRGRWKVVRSQKDLLLAASSDGTNLDRGEARLLAHLFPDDEALRLRDTDALYLNSVVRGRFSIHASDARLPAPEDRKTFLWVYENLEKLRPADQKVAVRHAAAILNEWSKLPKEVPMRMDEHMRLFFAVRTHLRASVVKRVILHVFKKNRYWLGTNPSDLIWVRDIFPTITDGKLRSQIYLGIERGAGAYSTTTNPEILLVNAMCLIEYAKRDYLLLDYKLQGIESAYNSTMETALDPDKQKVMSEVRDLIDQVPEAIAQRLAEIDRRRRDLDEMFSKWGQDKRVSQAA